MRRPPRARRPGRSAKESLRRGIFLIPSLFTVGNMLCGFASILHAMHGRLELAGWLILLAGVLDGLDGRIARLTRASSEFGKEYDSLADVISFGVAPAILTYQWGLWSLGRWGWAVAFLFLVAGSVRLARFNVHAHEGDRRYFVGLPIPGGAGAVSVMVLVSPEPVIDRAATAAVWVFVLIVAILMVSMIPYRSYKDFDLRQRWPATALFVIAVVLAVIVVSPVPTMAVICAIYLLAGPAELALRKLRRPTASTIESTKAEALAGESGATSPDHP
jgi:CDP-diacylglycerol--serine O-phosphatidyltransferase